MKAAPMTSSPVRFTTCFHQLPRLLNILQKDTKRVRDDEIRTDPFPSELKARGEENIVVLTLAETVLQEVERCLPMVSKRRNNVERTY